MDQGWITLHRKLQDWEWYTSPNHVFFLIHLLLKANHKDGKWRGHSYKRGDVLTSLSKLQDETGLSKQNIRTILKNLDKTGEINTLPNTKLTHISICKYDIYQRLGDQPNTPTNTELTQSQHTPNTDLTTNNNDNNYNNENNNNRNIFRPPTISEVQEYCKERGNSVDAEHFLDHNETRGWFTSNGKKMKCWKSAVRTWEKYQGRFGNSNHDPLKTANHGLSLNKQGF